MFKKIDDIIISQSERACVLLNSSETSFGKVNVFLGHQAWLLADPRGFDICRKGRGIPAPYDLYNSRIQHYMWI